MLLFFITACAGHQSLLKYKEPSTNLLFSESYSRINSDNIDEKVMEHSPVALCYQNRFTPAYEIFSKIKRNQQPDFNYWNQLGTCHFLEKHYITAQFFYQTAFSKASSKYEKAIYYNNIAIIYQAEKLWDKALFFYQKAKKQAPTLLTPSFNLAYLYLRFYLTDKAIQEFSALHKRNSKDVDVILGLAQSYLLKQDEKKALFYYNQLDKKYRIRIDAIFNYALTLSINGQHELALGTMDDLELKKNSQLISYYNNVRSYIDKKRNSTIKKKR